MSTGGPCSWTVKNPSAPNSYGMRLFREQRFEESIPHLKAAIEIGFATSDSFSYLATAESLFGDSLGAERTMAKAAGLYPRSVFVLVRHGLLQRENRQPVRLRSDAREGRIKLTLGLPGHGKR